MVLHFALNDNYVPAEAVARVKVAFAGRDAIEVYEYPGARHGFNRPDGGDYDKPAASMAQTRTIALFHPVMGPHFDLAPLSVQQPTSYSRLPRSAPSSRP